MDGERGLAPSHRLLSLAEKFHDKRYRVGYIASHTRGVLAQQMRNFRGDLSQADYAAKIGKQKTVIGRLENPAYGGWSLRTMFEIAQKENVAVLARFVDFPTFLAFTDDMSDDALHPEAYEEAELDRFAAYQTLQTSSSQAIRLPTDIYGGGQIGGGWYPDIFFGGGGAPFNPQTVYGSGNPAGAINITSAVSGSGFAISNSGVLVGGSGQTMTFGGYPGPFAVAPMSTAPATPIALKRAHAEIRRLNGIVGAQGQQIRGLETKMHLLQSIIPPAGQVQEQSSVQQLSAANQNVPIWQLRA